MRAAAWVFAAACAAPVEAPLVAIAPPPPVCVSEFMASNAGSVVIDGAAPDWVELHNPGAEDQSLDGWTLGDRVDEDVVVFPPMPSDFVRRRLAPCCAEAGCWRLEPDATLGVL
jgi:hypothetical protein